jgi:V/A-type H+-transporting ATPase subunit K
MKFVLILSIVEVLSLIFAGVYTIYKNTEADKKKLKAVMRLNLVFFIPIIALIAITIIPDFVHAQAAGDSSSGLGFIAAGLSTGLASLGAGVAVSSVGSSAIGAVSEDPKILGKSMIFLGLAEGIAIYGLIISIMILGRL